MKKILYVIVITSISLSINLCDSCGRKNEKKFEVKTEQIKDIKKNVNTTIFRYEKDLFSLNVNKFSDELKILQKKYPFFLEGNIEDPKNQKQLYDFITDPLTKEIYQTTMKKFPDISNIKADFDDAFSYYAYYYPNNKIPIVYTYVSSLDYQLPIKYLDSIMIIALDMYLGADCKYYSQLGAPAYITSRYSKEYIVADCIKEMAFTNMQFENAKVTLLDQMITEGKRLYFAESMLPETNDTILIGYPLLKLEWAKKNEANIWGYIIQNNLLFTTDSKKIMKFMGEAPFTSFFQKDSPGRIGAWVGWQIVRAYMNNNANSKLQDMLNEKNAQKILNISKYKPKK